MKFQVGFMALSISALCILLAPASADSRVRKVVVLDDQIVAVKTALGIATIIQVPDSPNSVVVGDQSAFKVEYLDRAITIKPLSAGARSNLYVYTDWRRYNVQLLIGPPVAADYVVYLENPRQAPRPVKSGTAWVQFSGQIKNEDVSLEVRRLGRAGANLLLVEFTIRGRKTERLRPEWIWLVQLGSTRPIQSLFLSSLTLRPSSPIRGTVQILRDDLEDRVNLRLEIRREITSGLEIPWVALWR